MRNFIAALFPVIAVLSLPTNIEAAVNTKIVHHAPDFEVTANKVNGALEIKAVAPPLHHFNLKAPMSVTREGTTSFLNPSQAKDQIVFFRVNDLNSANYEVLLYLCDDAKTYCEKHKVSAKWNGKKSELQAQSADTDPVNLNTPLHPSAKYLVPTGQAEFILNHPEKALIEARQKNKPLLIDFFGIWCPPCNELDEVVFSSPEFKKQSSAFIKLKLDSDSPESWSLKSKYNVTGYPTVIFAAPNGDEISRIVGFRNEQVFLGYMKDALDFRTVNLKRSDILTARAESTQTTQQDKNRVLLAQLSQKSPKSPQELRTVIEIAKKIVEIPESRTADDEFTHADLWTLIAESFEELHETKNAQASWNKAADEFRKKMKSGAERGFNLELAHCNWKAGQFEAADKIYQTFENRYPKEFTFYFNHATMKMAQKKWAETESLAKKALEFSYGDNKLRAAFLMAQTLGAQDRMLEAKKLIDNVLNSFPVPEDPNIRTHRYIRKLREFNSNPPV